MQLVIWGQYLLQEGNKLGLPLSFHYRWEEVEKEDLLSASSPTKSQQTCADGYLSNLPFFASDFNYTGSLLRSSPNTSQHAPQSVTRVKEMKSRDTLMMGICQHSQGEGGENRENSTNFRLSQSAWERTKLIKGACVVLQPF